MITDRTEQVASLLAEADALMEVRRYSEAEERASQAVAIAPEDPNAFCAWSRAQQALGRYTDAVRSAEEAIRMAPHSPAGFRLRASALSAQATREHGPGRTRLAYEAANSAREAIRIAPQNPNGYIQLANALRLTHESRDAYAAAQEAIRLAPNSAATWVTASLVALSNRNWESAIRASRKALTIEPSNYAALNNLGVALRGAGRRREGHRVLAEATRIDPDAPTARNNLTNAGLNVARILIMVLLIPIGFLAHVGLGLYLIFALVSNVLISRYPDKVLRLERWLVPIALFFSKRDLEDVLSGPTNHDSGEDGRSGSSWAESGGPRDFGWLALLLVAIFMWAMTATVIFMAVWIGAPGGDKFVLAAVALVLAGLAMWPTLVIRGRRQP
jgi:tetratricopeptide (TPR) repeat protein